MEFKFSVNLDKDILLVTWPQKSASTEAEFAHLGGAFETFNTYRFPLSPRSIRKAVTKARELGTVRYTPEAKNTFNGVLEKEKSAKELSGGDADAEISPLLKREAPLAAKSLRPYQRAAVKFMSVNPYTLLADEPGAGKTLQTIATMVSAGVTGDILVLSPSIATQIVWPDELRKWAPDEEVVRVVGSRKQREAQLAKLRFFSSTSKRRWILCNLEMVSTKYHGPAVVNGVSYPQRYEHRWPELFFLDYWEKKPKKKREWDAIVVDESHRALITNKSQSYKQTLLRCGFGKLSTKPGGKRIAISGTPFRGKLQNLWGTLNWLDPKKYSAYWDWVNHWFSTENKWHGGTEIMELDNKSRKEFYEAMSTFTLRRTKKEIAKDLPDKMYAGSVPDGMGEDLTDEERKGLVGHWLEMEPKQKRAYEQMVEEAIANLDNGTLVANGVLAEMTRLKQFAGCYGKLEKKMDSDGFEVDVFKPELPSNKLNWLVEFLAELGIDREGDSGPDARKVVVASQFTSLIDVMDKALNAKGIKTLKVTGAVNKEKRQKAAEIFQTDEGPQVFLLNTIAGGVALTLDRADDLVILDETFIPDDQSQVEDRIHRVSRVHNVTIHYVRSIGTIEERIAKLTFERDTVQKQILDGERGVDFARKLLV